MERVRVGLRNPDYFCAAVLFSLIQKTSKIEVLGRFLSQNTIINNIVVLKAFSMLKSLDVSKTSW